jgi:S1-C subfamily serine protease
LALSRPFASGYHDVAAFIDQDRVMPGDFDFDDEPDPVPRRPSQSRRDLDDPPSARYGRARRPGVSPLLIVALVGGGVMFLAAVVVAVLVVRKAAREDGPVAEAKGPTQTTPPAIVAPRSAAAPARKDPDPATGSPSREVVDRVKSATVRVRVLFRNGQGGSGTGFVEKNSRMVLTNAHVVGLLQKKGEPKLGGARAIELVVNSGEPGKEYSLGGELVAADTENDLALLRPYLLEPGARHLVPDGLVVPRSANATLLQRLFVFGYPFGEQLGTEITVSETSVSSLRMDQATGKLAAIQVKGGMNPGNSGGPVVDVKGNVIGVAVAGIQGTDINFAIPGELVQEFLAKRR